MKEKVINAKPGFLFLLIAFLLVAIGAYLYFDGIIQFPPIIASGVILAIFIINGLMIINPNESRVLTFFGKYVGTVKENGFLWVNPFYKKRKISLRASNFDSERVKVNDKRGNPILISVILVWRVNETYKAAFDVDNYESFVRVQTDAAVRKLAGMTALMTNKWRLHFGQMLEQ